MPAATRKPRHGPPTTATERAAAIARIREFLLGVCHGAGADQGSAVVIVALAEVYQACAGDFVRDALEQGGEEARGQAQELLAALRTQFDQALNKAIIETAPGSATQH